MSVNTRSKRFTFLTEKEGSTIVEQFTAHNLLDAVVRWVHESQTRPGEPLEGDVPTPVEGIENVWCTAGHDPQGSFYLVHIVATSSTDNHEGLSEDG